MEQPRWSVVIPYFNEKDYLAPTLASLFAQDLGSFRLVLVDNASTDGSGALARRIAAAHPGIETVHLAETRPGKIHALECAFAAVTTPYVAFCDADTFYPPHYLRRCEDLLREPGVVAAMAMDLPPDLASSAARFKRVKVMIVSKLLPRQAHTGGFGQAFRADALRKAGGYTANLWPYVLEDHEVMQRVFKQGRALYARDLWCVTSGRRKHRASVGWTLGERLLYHATPFVLKDWFFYRFLKARFSARALANTALREKSWV
jgi:glycosyltransferase involved in cell wall biosynthesis